jgi:hypothetical protein
MRPRAPPDTVTVAHRPPLCRPRILAAAAPAAVLAAAGVSAAFLLTNPSYPHAWCGPVLAELHAKGGSEQGYETTMAQIEQRDHAPVGQLLSDLYAYGAAYSGEQAADNVQVLGAIGNTMGTLNAVGNDLKAINAQCGQPPGAYKTDAL